MFSSTLQDGQTDGWFTRIRSLISDDHRNPHSSRLLLQPSPSVIPSHISEQQSDSSAPSAPSSSSSSSFFHSTPQSDVEYLIPREYHDAVFSAVASCYSSRNNHYVDNGYQSLVYAGIMLTLPMVAQISSFSHFSQLASLTKTTPSTSSHTNETTTTSTIANSSHSGNDHSDPLLFKSSKSLPTIYQANQESLSSKQNILPSCHVPHVIPHNSPRNICQWIEIVILSITLCAYSLIVAFHCLKLVYQVLQPHSSTTPPFPQILKDILSLKIFFVMLSSVSMSYLVASSLYILYHALIAKIGDYFLLPITCLSSEQIQSFPSHINVDDPSICVLMRQRFPSLLSHSMMLVGSFLALSPSVYYIITKQYLNASVQLLFVIPPMAILTYVACAQRFFGNYLDQSAPAPQDVGIFPSSASFLPPLPTYNSVTGEINISLENHRFNRTNHNFVPRFAHQHDYPNNHNTLGILQSEIDTSIIVPSLQTSQISQRYDAGEDGDEDADDNDQTDHDADNQAPVLMNSSKDLQSDRQRGGETDNLHHSSDAIAFGI